MFVHEKILNGHTVQVASNGEGFAAFVCVTCCFSEAGVVLFGIADWDDTDPTSQAAQHAVDHSLTPPR